MTLAQVVLSPSGEQITGTLQAVSDTVGAEIDAVNYQSVQVQIVGTFVGTIAFQVSNDGVNWATKQLISSTGASQTSTTAPSIAAGDISARYFRVLMTVYTSGQATAIIGFSGASQSNNIATQAVSGSLSVNGSGTGSIAKAEDAASSSGDLGVPAWGVRRDAPTTSASANGDYNELAVSRHGAIYTMGIDAAKRTYAAAAKITPSPGQVLEIVGAASTTVEINRITLTLFGTAAGKIDVIVNKRSAAATGGTSTTPTKVPYDSSDAAAAASVKVYTANPSVGGVVGPVRQGMLGVDGVKPSDRLRIESGTYSKSFTLTSAAQTITVDLAGTMPTGAELAIDVEWTEY